MGMPDLETALQLVEQHPGECFFVGPRDEALLAAAEDALGLVFPPTYRAFLSRLGAGNVGAEEIYGVIDKDFTDSGVPDGIWMTLRARREWGLPIGMVVVYFDGGTDYFVLDTADGAEARVRRWRPGVSKPGDDLSEVAPDFGSFFLDITRRALER